ncbi:cytochrome P450 [Shimazuella sp. AN120528]|uniref:cytochrome P450 n=1 Tax=Shimazuella soli TaxID=1892854 RepID=UPI001F10DA1F|nr:cytochrome P450 [Shimazuella soli]MCH5584816.1 cytochrome P450 [Shimazuella soli]
MKQQTGVEFFSRRVHNHELQKNLYEPFSWYRYMRDNHPVFYDKEQQFWDVFLYDDVKQVLENSRVFSSNRKGDDPISQSMISLDPPKHTLMRSLVNQAFTPRVLNNWYSRIQLIARELLNEVNGQSSFDLIRKFAYPLPMIVIAEIIGVPSTDRDQFKKWSDIIVSGPADHTEEAIRLHSQKFWETMKELRAYFFQIIDEKRKNNKEDEGILSILIQAKQNEKKLTDEEILSFCILLLVAGNETTTNLIGNSIYCLLDNYQTFMEVQQNQQLLPKAIEEVLRFRSPLQSFNRIVKEDIILGKQLIPKGSQIIVWIGSANRDERQFHNPDQFDIHRSSNPHLAFGKGIHFCLGAPLARMEAKIALQELLVRYPQIKFQQPMKLEPVKSHFTYGLEHLWIEVGTSNDQNRS